MRLTKQQQELLDFLALGCEAVETFSKAWFCSFFNLRNGRSELLRMELKTKGIEMIFKKDKVVLTCKRKEQEP